MDVHNPQTPLWRGLKAVDWLGSLALLAVTVMTLLGLDIGGEYMQWTSPKVLALILVGLAFALVFYLVEARVAAFPLMPVQVFKNRSSAATIAVGAVHAFVHTHPYLRLLKDTC
jgi:Fungal trichothecene efflux pump (TRI12)